MAILEKLTLGEKVAWDREVYPDLLPSMIQRYGDGPFRVVGLRLWRGSTGISVAPYTVTIEVSPGGITADLAGEWLTRAV